MTTSTPVTTPDIPRQRIRPRALLRASGGPRYAVALGVDALGAGMQRPFLLIYGVEVLHMSAPVAGLAMTIGAVAGLVATPFTGRWLDRGPRSTVVAAAMLVRVLGTLLLLTAPTGAVAWFAAAALLVGIGNQTMPAAHAALVSTVSAGRERDAALAAARSIRNAGMGAGALLATVALAGGVTALRTLALGTGGSYLVAAVLAWSVHVHAAPGGSGTAPRGQAEPAAARMRTLLCANVVYVFCLNIPEIALPLIIVTQLHTSPIWASGIFVANTVLVVALQVPVTVWMSRFSRRTAMAVAGVVVAVSYVGFLGAQMLGGASAAPAILAVSVLCTLGEIIYAGSSTALIAASVPESALGRALAGFQLSTGFGLAVSPAVITILAAHGSAVLWLSLTGATLIAAAAVRNPTSVSGGRRPSGRQVRSGIRPRWSKKTGG